MFHALTAPSEPVNRHLGVFSDNGDGALKTLNSMEGDMKTFTIMGAAMALVLTACASNTAEKADCSPGKSGDDLTYAEANVVYNCIADGLHAGYKKGKKRWVNASFIADYRAAR